MRFTFRISRIRVASYTVVLFFFFLFFSPAFGAQTAKLEATPLGFGYSIPDDNNVMVRYGNAVGTLTSGEKVKVITWNVQKFENLDAYRDLRALAKRSQIVALQESMMGPTYEDYFSDFKFVGWLGAISFLDSEYKGTGVATGAKLAIFDASYIRSDAREPFTETPKMIALTTYEVEDRMPLLVANVHGINFVPTWIFKSQMDQLEKVLVTHRGPLILIGDFNTHVGGRMQVLNDLANRLSLKEVPVTENRRFMKLDHIFVRGFKINGGRVVNEVNSSDHWPLEADLELQ